MIVGTLFMGHGLQKLAGWFGGHGLSATAEQFQSMGLRPGKLHAAASGAAETLGGALVGAGLLTPLGSSLISASMITAIRKVHGKNGVWVSEGGFEYNLVLLGTVFALADAGPGALSLDGARGRRHAGLAWALAQLAAGAAGSSAAVALGQRAGEQGPSAGGEADAQAQDGFGSPAEANGHHASVAASI
jgi:putative oxidoreductase